MEGSLASSRRKTISELRPAFRGEFGRFPVFRFGSIVGFALGGCKLDPVMHSFHRCFGSAAGGASGRRRKMTIEIAAKIVQELWRQ